jgi:hypothetical protein
MDEAALQNSTETEVDMGLLYIAIQNIGNAKTHPHLLKTLQTGYGLSLKDAKAVLSDRVEHFKKVIFEQYGMTEEFYNKAIKDNME